MGLGVYLIKDYCPHCGRSDEVFHQNITHNLRAMAHEAGIYKAVWRPEEMGIKHAHQLVELLTAAIAEMEADPERFEAHNAANGLGMYYNFLPWLRRYLAACKASPNAVVEVYR